MGLASWNNTISYFTELWNMLLTVPQHRVQTEYRVLRTAVLYSDGPVPGRIGGSVDINTVPLAMYMSRCALLSKHSVYKDRIWFLEQTAQEYTFNAIQLTWPTIQGCCYSVKLSPFFHQRLTCRSSLNARSWGRSNMDGVPWGWWWWQLIFNSDFLLVE